jgi:hypothetical protein
MALGTLPGAPGLSFAGAGFLALATDSSSDAGLVVLAIFSALPSSAFSTGFVFTWNLLTDCGFNATARLDTHCSVGALWEVAFRRNPQLWISHR